MRRVVIEELTPGMILAKPVTNTAGLVVLPSGAELNEAALARLQRLGLASVCIEGNDGRCDFRPDQPRNQAAARTIPLPNRTSPPFPVSPGHEHL